MQANEALGCCKQAQKTRMLIEIGMVKTRVMKFQVRMRKLETGLETMSFVLFSWERICSCPNKPCEAEVNGG